MIIKFNITQNTYYFRIIFVKIIQIVSILFFLFLLAPNTLYQMPDLGVDGSWAIALGMAINKGFTFGKDFIFTYGPWGHFATRIPMGISKFQYFFFDLIFLSHLAFILYYILNTHKGFTPYLLIFLTIDMLGYFYNADIVMPITWILLFHFFYFNKFKNIFSLVNSIVITIFLFFVKMNVGIVAIVLLYLFFAYQLITKSLTYKQVIIYSVLHLCVLIVLCIILDVNIIGYLLGSIHLIDAYNDAMSLFLPLYGQVLPVAIAIIILYVLIFFRHFKLFLKQYNIFFVYTITAIMVYILFKQGFVRADIQHVLAFYKFIALFLSLPLIFSDYPIKASFVKLLVFSIFLLYLTIDNINQNRTIINKAALFDHNKIANKVSYLKDYYVNLSKDNYKLDDGYFKQQRQIPTNLLSIIGNKTVDLVPSEISYIHVNNLNYNPRPVIQSYSAYDAYLDNKNYEKYISSTAPEYILFQMASIDSRSPFYDESKTKLAILQNYEVVDRSWDYLLLKRLKEPLAATVTKTTSSIHKLNNYINIDDSNELQYAKIKVKYSLWGKIQRLLFQPPEIYISIKFEDQSEETYKVAKTILEGGVIINRYVSTNINSSDLFITYNGEKNKKVVQLKVYTSTPGGFKECFEIEKTYIHIDAASKAKPDFVARQNPPLQNITLPPATNNIQGNIELFEDSEEYIEIRGWACIAGLSTENSKTYIVFKAREKEFVYPAILFNRPDVGGHLNINAIHAGYHFLLYKKDLPIENYQIGIYIDNNGVDKALTYTDKSMHLITFHPSISNIQLSDETNNVHYSIDVFEDSFEAIKIKGWAHINDMSSENSHTYVVLQSTENSHIYDTTVDIRNDVSAAFAPLNLDQSGFTSIISKKNLKPGPYKIGLFIQKNKEIKGLQFIDKQINVK